MRIFYRGVLILVGVSLAFFFLYKTEPPTPISPAELSPIATFGDVSLRIEFATTSTTRELGLGNRTSVPDGYGMLFVFAKDGSYGFWMKDTLVPLDIFWLDDKGQVVSISESIAPSTYPNVFYPSVPARYVLETSAGFARAHSILPGTPLLLKNFPSVSE